MFVNHQGKDTHLGGTSVVKFDSTLLKLGGIIKSVPAKVDGAVTEVTNEFSASDVLHDRNFEKTNEGNDLGKSSSRDGLEGSKSVGDGGKAGAGVVNVSWKTDATFGSKVTGNGKHGNTAVLQLDVSKTIEFSLVTVSDKTKRIPVAKGDLGTKFIFESRKSRGGSLLGGRGKGGGDGKEGGKNSGLHRGSSCSVYQKS